MDPPCPPELIGSLTQGEKRLLPGMPERVRDLLGETKRNTVPMARFIGKRTFLGLGIPSVIRQMGFRVFYQFYQR